MKVSRYTMFIEEVDVPDELMKAYIEADTGEAETAAQNAVEAYILTIPDRSPAIPADLIMYLPADQRPV